MNNTASDAILRLVNLANRVRPYDWLKQFEITVSWRPEAVRSWQHLELTATLEHALDTVPYYRERVPRRLLQDVSKNVAALSDFPILTKDQVRENFDALQSSTWFDKPKQDISTSGSTGKPLRVIHDNAAFGRYFAAKFRALRWYGVNFGDRQLRVWGMMFAKNKQLYWRVRDALQNRRRISSLDLSDETLEKAFAELVRFRPTYINGYTSAIQRFAAFIEQTGKNGRALGSWVVIPTAEVLYEWQRQQMQRVFGCPVMNEYGGCEIPAMAYECPSGHMHVTHENFIVEVLDERGNPVAEGEEGLLTATSLCGRAMPLIRYQNGDVVTKTADVNCACGRQAGLWGFGRIVGRSSDVLLRTDGQPTHWTTLYYAIKDAFVPGMVLEHQARQKARDLIEILVIKGPIYSDRAMDRFLTRIRSVLGKDVRLDVRFVEDIPREKSGKHRYFISDLREGQQDDERAPLQQPAAQN